MGVVRTISADRWPKQGSHLGHEVNVCFHYDTSRTFPGVVIRDDAEEPHITIIKVQIGVVTRWVLASECHYSLR